MKTKAVIFDMDGVISDTQDICAITESKLLVEYGIDLDQKTITKMYAGVASQDMLKDVFKKFNKTIPDLKSLIQEKRKRIREACEGNVKAVPGTLEFIKKLQKAKIPMAVASAAHREFIEFILTELGIRSVFQVIASSDDVDYGKPEPDIFLFAAQHLSVQRHLCLVVEDGISGMIAAKKAGMHCIGLVRKGKLSKKIYPATELVRSLKNIKLKNL